MEFVSTAAAVIAEKVTEVVQLESLRVSTVEGVTQHLEAVSSTDAKHAMEVMKVSEANVLELKSPVIEIPTRNQHLEGGFHPDTGVIFERNRVELPDGTMYEGIYPVFEGPFDAVLPEEMFLESDRAHFNYANEKLKEAVAENPELANQFNELQLEQIEAGETPDGYVWHHHEEPGRLQLMDEQIHAQTGHSGGRSLWGGGSDFR